MASIPRVLSSTNSLNNLPESEKIYFLNGQSTLKELYGSHVFSLTDAFPFQIYSLCKELDCFVYIVKDGVSDHILNIASNGDRKSTRLNSSHVRISYAVFCLK